MNSFFLFFFILFLYLSLQIRLTPYYLVENLDKCWLRIFYNVGLEKYLF